MNVFVRIRRSEEGLTLIEVMAALMIFAVMTLGITPVLISSVRGAALSRSMTVGKNVALEAMERTRGLPFFVSNATKKLDVLDLYFPNLGAGYAAGSGDNAHTFTTTCAPSVPPSQECPAGKPPGYTVTFRAQFVQAAASGTGYTPVAPPPTYTWNSTVNDKPPTQLLRMSITSSWTVGAETKTFNLTGLLGDRKVGTDRITGQAKVDYLVQILGTYKDAVGRRSNLTVKGGSGQADAEARLLSKAAINTQAYSARLTREPSVTESNSVELASMNGATWIYAAPPDSADPAAPEGASAGTLVHPDLVGSPLVTGMASSITSAPLRAKVAGDLPVAAGTNLLNNGAASIFDMWVNTDTNGNRLQLAADSLSSPNPNRPVTFVRRLNNQSLTASTSVETTAVGTAGRHVRSIASGKFGQFNLFPVNFVPSGNPDGRSVILINNFDAELDCKSTANPSTAAAATRYTAQLKYWRETDPNDGVAAGLYETIPLDSSLASDPLASFSPNGNNPLVWEDPSSAGSNGSDNDVYLFPVHHDHGLLGLVKHDHPGYLSTSDGWSSAVGIATSAPGVSDGRVTKSSLNGAIRINTVPLNPAVPESNLSISIGNLSCAASDLR